MRKPSLPDHSSRGLSDYVHETLRREILAGHFRPGQWLVETEIAEQLNISRGPVREALRRLQEEGIVVAVPNRGKVVAFCDERSIRELHTLRALLEGFAVKHLCADDRRQKVVSRLKQIVDRMESVTSEKEISRFSELDFAFHQEIVSAVGMPYLLKMWGSLNGLLVMWLLSIQEIVWQTIDDVRSDHMAIAEAIEFGDAELAERRLVEHIVVRGDHLLKEASPRETIKTRPKPPRRRTKRNGSM